jgi:hypothetical protein
VSRFLRIADDLWVARRAITLVTRRPDGSLALGIKVPSPFHDGFVGVRIAPEEAEDFLARLGIASDGPLG